MIEKVIINSCEHQRYRRAGLIALLEHFKYPASMIDVVWGLHADYHSKEEIHESLHKNGISDAIIKTFHAEGDDYGTSNTDAKIRCLIKIIEDNENTLICEDDHYPIIDRHQLSAEIYQLNKVTEEQLGVIQVYGRGNPINDISEEPIPGAINFMRGCNRSGHHLFFVTPFGAKKLLEYLRDPKTNGAIENALPRKLSESKWLFSTIDPKRYGNHLQSLEGNSIGVRLTEINVERRRTEGRIAYVKDVIERFKL